MRPRFLAPACIPDLAGPVAGAIGLVIPGLTAVLPWLTPLAAAGQIVLMVGAAVTHFRIKEIAMASAPIVLILLLGAVIWGRREALLAVQPRA